MLEVGIQIKFGIAINVNVSAKIPEDIMLQNILFLSSSICTSKNSKYLESIIPNLVITRL